MSSCTNYYFCLAMRLHHLVLQNPPSDNWVQHSNPRIPIGQVATSLRVSSRLHTRVRLQRVDKLPNAEIMNPGSRINT